MDDNILEERIIEDSDNSNQENQNIKKYIMALLFIQTKELKRKFENKMELSPEQYRLVNKEWLDNFKNSYNYNEAIQNFNSYNDWSNYHDFKYKICMQLKINENRITNEDQNIMNNCQIKKEKHQSNFEYPIDIELVKEQFFQDCNLGNIGFPMCNIYLGDKLIFVIDDQRDNIAYHCSLVETQENTNNFLIQVKNILLFQRSNILNDQLDKIISEGFDNYLSKRNIVFNSNNQQNIIDPNSHISIGYFINLVNENNNNFINNNNNQNLNLIMNNQQNSNNNQTQNIMVNNQLYSDNIQMQNQMMDNQPYSNNNQNINPMMNNQPNSNNNQTQNQIMDNQIFLNNNQNLNPIMNNQKYSNNNQESNQIMNNQQNSDNNQIQNQMMNNQQNSDDNQIQNQMMKSLHLLFFNSSF